MADAGNDPCGRGRMLARGTQRIEALDDRADALPLACEAIWPLLLPKLAENMACLSIAWRASDIFSPLIDDAVPASCVSVGGSLLLER